MIKISSQSRMPSALPETFEQSRSFTRYHARSFYFSSYMLPREKRMAAYAVYAFCRFADDVIDRAAEKPVDRTEVVTRLHRLLDGLYEGGNLRGHRQHAFTETVHRYDIPKSYFLDLIDGVTTDLEKTRYESFFELYDYCYKVAGVVGLIMCRIFGYSDPVALCYAEDLGTAMQLTNILRDIREDALMDRVYIPREDLERFSIDESMIKAGVRNADFRALMQFQISRARMYYSRSAEGISLLTDDGSRKSVVLMNRIYSGILDEIERSGYDIYARRHRVHLGKKLWIYATAGRGKVPTSPVAPHPVLQPLVSPAEAKLHA
jgi:15-cis-phytoene synthase